MATAHTNLEKYTLLQLSKRPYLRGWDNETGAVKVNDRFISFGKKGSTDILAYLAPLGRGVCIEVKIKPDKLSKSQIIFRDVVTSLGVLHFVVYDEDDVNRTMEILDQEHLKLVKLMGML